MTTPPTCPRHRLPPATGPRAATRWVVTAPQKESRLAAARRPWGTVHIKRSGDLFTACGEPAANWFVFWDHRFAPAGPETCEPCGRAWIAGPGVR